MGRVHNIRLSVHDMIDDGGEHAIPSWNQYAVIGYPGYRMNCVMCCIPRYIHVSPCCTYLFLLSKSWITGRKGVSSGQYIQRMPSISRFA